MNLYIATLGFIFNGRGYLWPVSAPLASEADAQEAAEAAFAFVPDAPCYGTKPHPDNAPPPRLRAIQGGRNPDRAPEPPEPEPPAMGAAGACPEPEPERERPEFAADFDAADTLSALISVGDVFRGARFAGPHTQRALRHALTLSALQDVMAALVADGACERYDAALIEAMEDLDRLHPGPACVAGPHPDDCECCCRYCGGPPGEPACPAQRG